MHLLTQRGFNPRTYRGRTDTPSFFVNNSRKKRSIVTKLSMPSPYSI